MKASAYPTYADAILDRLVHNAHRIDLAGDSLRRTRPRSALEGLTSGYAFVAKKTLASRTTLKQATSCRNSERHDLGMTERHRRDPHPRQKISVRVVIAS